MDKIKKVNCKIFFLTVCFFLSICVLIGRLYCLQILDHEKLYNKSEKQYKKILHIKKDRGTIYDRNLKELAVSVKAHSVFANINEIEDLNKTVSILSSSLKIRKNNLLKKFKSRKNFIWIKRKITPNETVKLKEKKIKGIGFIEEDKRFYPKRNLAANIIGFVGMDNKGLAGLEYEFNKFIEGKEEMVLMEKDAKGRIIKYAEKWFNPSKGCSLVTTIDEVIQHIAEKELKKAVIGGGAKGGVVIIMEPASGDILAIANYPSFNPNSYNKYSPKSWVNQGVAYSYEPGSTFKLILTAAALEEKKVTPEDLFFCENGQMKIGGIVIHDTHKHGWMTTKQIIGKSSNVGAIKIGQKLEKELFYKNIIKFGFGKKTGIDLPGESAGILRNASRWTAASLGAISIGHEIAVTPIQLITAVSSIANGGLMVKPRIVKKIIKNGETVKEFLPKKTRRIISKDNSRKLSKILEYVVTDGTGTLAALKGYKVAGKTGTAQKIDPKTRTYSKEKFYASFVGFLPADNPALAMLVVINEPKKVIYGGKIAAPVFREIARKVLRYLRIPSDDTNINDYVTNIFQENRNILKNKRLF